VRHVLPNTLAPLIVLATAQLGSAILVEAALSFLGLGILDQMRDSVQKPHFWGEGAAQVYRAV
jgi:ABC-type dipeptide/oligopeptide/nickel transport system permease subunit